MKRRILPSWLEIIAYIIIAGLTFAITLALVHAVDVFITAYMAITQD